MIVNWSVDGTGHPVVELIPEPGDSYQGPGYYGYPEHGPAWITEYIGPVSSTYMPGGGNTSPGMAPPTGIVGPINTGPVLGPISSPGAPIAVGGAIVTLSSLLARLGPYAARIAQWIRGLGVVRGTVKRWSELPDWFRQILILLGVQQGIELVLDVGPDDFGLIQLPGTSDLPGVVGGVQVIGGWNANGVQFYRLADGRMAVRRKNGQIRMWRPKRPIVIYAGGASKLTTLLRGDRALDRQAKRLGKMLQRRAPRKGGSSSKAAVNVSKTEVRS